MRILYPRVTVGNMAFQISRLSRCRANSSRRILALQPLAVSGLAGRPTIRDPLGNTISSCLNFVSLSTQKSDSSSLMAFPIALACMAAFCISSLLWRSPAERNTHMTVPSMQSSTASNEVPKDLPPWRVITPILNRLRSWTQVFW